MVHVTFVGFYHYTNCVVKKSDLGTFNELSTPLRPFEPRHFSLQFRSEIVDLSIELKENETIKIQRGSIKMLYVGPYLNIVKVDRGQ